MLRQVKTQQQGLIEASWALMEALHQKAVRPIPQLLPATVPLEASDLLGALEARQLGGGMVLAPQPATCYSDAYLAQQALQLLQGCGSPLFEWNAGCSCYQVSAKCRLAQLQCIKYASVIPVPSPRCRLLGAVLHLSC